MQLYGVVGTSEMYAVTPGLENTLPAGAVPVATARPSPDAVLQADGSWLVDTKARRRADITAQLEAVDAASVRPLRVKMAGQGTPADDARLAELEQRAKALRAELSQLTL